MTLPPEVRQCQNPDHHLYGAVAVAAGADRWGIMHPQIGGHWGADVDVDGWKVMT